MVSVTVIALIAVAVFALLIGRLVGNQIEEQSVGRARDTAALIARASFAPRLPPAGARLAPQDVADLDRGAQDQRQVGCPVAVEVADRGGARLAADGGVDVRLERAVAVADEHGHRA